MQVYVGRATSNDVASSDKGDAWDVWITRNDKKDKNVGNSIFFTLFLSVFSLIFISF